MRSLLFALLSGSILLCSCADDLSSSASSRQLTFTPTVSSSWNQGTRSVSGPDVPQSMVTALEGYSRPLYLHTYYTDSIASPGSGSKTITRAAPITANAMFDKFGVSAYLYNDTWSETESMSLYFYDLAATKAGETYNLEQPYYWPGGECKMKFFAYAPKGDVNYKFSEKDKVGSPLIDITIPKNVAHQKDLLVAQSGEVKSNAYSSLPLTFNHALTAVRFICGDDMAKGEVTNIQITNAYSKGTYNLGTQLWSNQSAPIRYEQALHKETTGTPGEAITTDEQTFMMVPQTLPKDAELVVTFRNEPDFYYTLRAKIGGQVWPMGKTVNYKISTSSINWTYTLDVSGIEDFEYTGGMHSFFVKSIRTNSHFTNKPAPWTTQFSTDGGNTWTDTKPSWLTQFTTSGPGGGGNTGTATVAKGECNITAPHIDALKKATPKGSAAHPYNLANQTNGGAKVENTANCYVVNAPGYYSFPMVYGNAIKNGATNTSAYKTKATGTVLNTLYNHFGPITDPYITNNANCNIKSAELVWQDAKNLITDIRYVDKGMNGGYVSFKVSKSTIRPGNAVIAVKRPEGTILWSWHIWVTHDDLYKTTEITNAKGKKFNVSPLNLGWCGAIGIGIDVEAPEGNMIVDIGGGSTEIAVISLGGIVSNNSIRTAGDDLTADIQEYMSRQHNVKVSERMAERIKIHVGSALTDLGDEAPEDFIVHGPNRITALPMEVPVCYQEIAHCLDKTVAKIENAVLSALENTPPELYADIVKNGIWLSGGGALLRGLDKRLQDKINIPFHIAEDPLHSVAKGAGIALKNVDRFSFLMR